MIRVMILSLLLGLNATTVQARDFEDGYAAYAAGAESCKRYLDAVNKGGVEHDYFINWLIGYLSAFNVIMPNTYDILGDTEFSVSQNWLNAHCKKYPRELFVNATARLTEVLYPTRKQSGLKKPPAAPPATTPQRNFKDIKIR